MTILSPLTPNSVGVPNPVSEPRPIASIATITPVTGVDQSKQLISNIISQGQVAIEKELAALINASTLRSLKLSLPILKDASNSILDFANLFKSDIPTSNLEVALKVLFEQLSKDQIVLNEESLKDPKKIFEFFKSFNDPQRREIIKDVALKLFELTKDLPTKDEFSSIKFINTEVSTFLLELSGNSSLADKKIAAQLLLSGIKNLLASMPETANSEIKNLVKNIVTVLDLAIKNNLPEPELKQLLTKIKAQSAEAFQPKELKEIEKALKAMDNFQTLQTLIQAQDNLSQLNQLFKTVDQPSLFIFGALIGGLLARANFESQDLSDDSQNPRREKKKGKFNQVQLNVSLPSLGAVAVNMSYRESEIMLRLTFENEDLARFAKLRTPMLCEALKDKGYQITEFDVTHGIINEIKAESLQDLSQDLGVFA